MSLETSPQPVENAKTEDPILEENTELINSQLAPGEYGKSYLGLRGAKLNTAVSLMAAIGFLLFGYDQGVMGGLLSEVPFRKQFPLIDTIKNPSNDTIQGAVVSLYDVGCLFGALACIFFGDKIGRRKSIVVGCIVMIIGATIQCSSFSTGQLIVGRLVTGLGNGVNTSTVPVWQSECAKPNKRGKLVMMAGCLIVVGFMISLWINLGLYFTDTSVSWRFPVGFQILFPLCILPFITALPESPRWLMKTGQIEEARHVFCALEDVPLDDKNVKREMREVADTLSSETRISVRSQVRDCFRQGKTNNFHRVCLGYFSQMLQQISGINLLSYYSTVIFENYMRLDAVKSRILSGASGTEYFLAAWVTIYCIERFGRRKLMLIGSTGQAICMAILCGCTWAADPKNGGNDKAAIAACVFVFGFNTSFAFGWLGMTWLYPAEITPLNIRAAANSISTAANWTWNFFVVMITPVLFHEIGPFSFAFFAVVNAIIVPVVYFLYPETTGRSLEEMDKIFELTDPRKPWQAVRIAYELPFEYSYNNEYVEIDSPQEEDKPKVEHVD